MGTLAILEQMLQLVEAQSEAVVAGDHQAVLSGADHHEQLLASLHTAEIDGSPTEIRELCTRIERAKSKLQRLLSAEATRVDFLLRLILGGGQSRAGGGYPGVAPRPEGGSRMLNRRA